MLQILILRFDAPLMSFGAVMIDQHGPIDRFPRLSMLTGLFANALGWSHTDFEKLEKLQANLLFAARWDIPPYAILDYQTVDLGQPKMMGYAHLEDRSKLKRGGWTTRGEVEWRGGASETGTHIRFRHYWANGVMTLAVSCIRDYHPTVEDLAHAVQEPVRPLFIGRKPCLPSTPFFIGVVEAPDVLRALECTPLYQDVVRKPTSTSVEACWPFGIADDYKANEVLIHDLRDWPNQLHTGSRIRCEGVIQVQEEKL